MSDCQNVKDQLPLWIGQDLADRSAANNVERHLKDCPSCDLYRRDLQSSLDVLQGLSAETLSVEGRHKSLWPKISERISQVAPANSNPDRRNQVSRWIPASVMMVAVAVIFAVSLPAIRDEIMDPQASNTSDLFSSPDDALNKDVKQSIKNSTNQNGESLGMPVKLEHQTKKGEK